MAQNEHEGHRRRMRERYLKGGMDGFAPHEALELLLYYALPRVNVNPLAHRLIDRFGTLQAVLHASPELLMQVEGVGESTAVLLSMVLPIYHLSALDYDGPKKSMKNMQSLKEYCAHLFHGERDEVLYVISLDLQMRVRHASKIGRGTIDHLMIYPRQVVSEALFYHAHSVVIAHNHPSGLAEPSEADILATDDVRAALGTVGIDLLDHIIYADGRMITIREWERYHAAAPFQVVPTPRKAAEPTQPRRKTQGQERQPDGDSPSP